MSWDVYMLYMRSMGWFFVFLTFGQMFLNAALSVYSSIWLSQWTDDDMFKPQYINNYTNTQRQHAVAKYLGVYGGLGAGQSKFYYILLFDLIYIFLRTTSYLWEPCVCKCKLLEILNKQFQKTMMVYLKLSIPNTGNIQPQSIQLEYYLFL